ncbi:MAG: hypothetical protein U0271_36280 [Polyangiaceae bacterium]
MSHGEIGTKTPGRPVDPGENWPLSKLIVICAVTLGSALVFLYFISPTP